MVSQPQKKIKPGVCKTLPLLCVIVYHFLVKVYIFFLWGEERQIQNQTRGVDNEMFKSIYWGVFQRLENNLQDLMNQFGSPKKGVRFRFLLKKIFTIFFVLSWIPRFLGH